MIRKRQRFFNIIQVSLDAMSLLTAYIVALYTVIDGSEFLSEWKFYVTDGLWMISLLLMVYYFMKVYTPMRSRLYRKEVLLILRAHLIGIVAIFSLLYIIQRLDYSREVSLHFALFGIILLSAERFTIRSTLRYLRRKGYNQKHMLIIGAGPMGMEFARKLRYHRDFGYNVIGFLDDDASKHDTTILGKRVLGNIDMLSNIFDSQTADEVIVALPFSAGEKYSSIVDICDKAGVRVRIIPDYNKFLSATPQIEEFDGIPLLNIRKIPLDDPFNRFLKRGFDILVSLVAILFTGPLMIIIALGIKLTSRGPVFFRQERVGLNNRPFAMLKFRSMRVASDNSAATVWTTSNDPRKTKFGSFLRKTSLDELPQFFNVLFGSMSVVGPRPERPFFVEQFKQEIPKYMVKHQVKPGITGWAQVNGWRGDTSIEKRIECDIYYIENWDLILDVKIMFLTVFSGMVNRNAY